MSMWVKICGNTSFEDAQVGAEAGADALGFVFAASPRHVTVEQVAAIVPNLPRSVEKIGVFVDASFEEIAATVEACGLTGVQLHFAAAPELPAQLRASFGPGLRILQVVHFDATAATETAAQNLDSQNFGSNIDASVDAILVDSRTAGAVGGTGKAFDWNLAAATLFRDAKVRLVAAGGLTPENVAQAIATLHPWGVDAVSGVEAMPGRKDPAKVRAFVANAKAASRT